MESLNKSTIIEGVASTSSKDSQGETLDLDGADITPLLEGRGFVNSDHGQTFDRMVGRVVSAKKIKSASECETASQVKFWTDIQRPFLWTKLELWDGHGHKEADAIGSIYNFYQDKNESAPIKLSVEGKTLERGHGGLLKRTLIKGVALTVHPANRMTRTDVVGLVKNAGASQDLIKSESYEVPVFIESKTTPIEKIYDLAVSARDLLKSLSKSEPNNSGTRKFLKCQEALDRLRSLKGPKGL